MQRQQEQEEQEQQEQEQEEQEHGALSLSWRRRQHAVSGVRHCASSVSQHHRWLLSELVGHGRCVRGVCGRGCGGCEGLHLRGECSLWQYLLLGPPESQQGV